MAAPSSALTTHCNIWGATDVFDLHLFSRFDIIQRPFSVDEIILRIKHNDPESLLLSLRLDDLNSAVLKRIGYILRQNTTLKELFISCHPTRPVSAFWLCVGIQMNRSIKELSMSDVRLGSPTQLTIFGDFVAENTSLEKLKLCRCQLGPDDINCISEHLMRCSTNTLKELDLSDNIRIGHNNNLDKLFQALTMKGVKCLNLSGNILVGESMDSLRRLLERKDSMIEELCISRNFISAETADQLISSLKNNIKLRRFDLGGDQDKSSTFQSVLQLVCDNSSISGVLKSNHTLFALVGSYNVLGNPSKLRNLWFTDKRQNKDPIELLYRCRLDGDNGQLLFSSFCLNESDSSTAMIAMRKILWCHARGDFNIGEASIDIVVMPRILAWVGSELLRYEADTRPLNVLATIKLNSFYRVVRVRPDLCFQNAGLASQLRVCQRDLGYSRYKNEKLQIENKRAQCENQQLRLEIERLRNQLSNQ